MTEHEVLQELYEQVMDRVFRTSGNYLMTKPKAGCEKEFYHNREMADVLEELMDRI